MRAIRLFDNRRSPFTLASVRSLLLLCSLCGLFGLVACGGSEPAPRVIVLGLDGLDPETVDLLMSEGKMPNFARLRQEGAYGRLVSQKPLLSPIIWTTIATGRGPEDHGIGHFVAIDDTTGEELPVTSRMRRVNALWNIASAAEKKVLTVGWWATWPPEEVHGHMVSDHTAYHFLFEDGFTGGKATEGKTYPPDLEERIAPWLKLPADMGMDELEPFVNVEASELDTNFSFDDELSHFRWALATTESYRQIGLELWRQERPELAMVYIEGTDSTSHLFGHLFRAEGLQGELAAQQAKYGQAVEAIYLYADRLLGDYLQAMDEHTTLVVLSDHGFELGALHDDPSKTRDLRRVSERFHRLEGVLYMLGPGIKARSRIDRPSIIDITPTVLSLLGLPAASDMPGRILTEAMDSAPPLERIATYELRHGAAATGQRDAVADDAVMAHLKSLGYLGGSSAVEEPKATSSPQGERNLAAIQFEAGRYREAAKIYRQLIDEQGNEADGSLHTSLAGAYGAMERYDEALKELERALEISPLNVEAYHNRAVIHERRGEIEKAVDDYTTALRYQPQYEPSRRALMRLVGTADVRAPRDTREVEAAQLADLASQAARKGDYDAALELLDQAEDAAPSYVLTYQYRSNVLYLKGEIKEAIKALELGLMIEPDNALFLENLKRLRAEPPRKPPAAN